LLHNLLLNPFPLFDVTRPSGLLALPVLLMMLFWTLGEGMALEEGIALALKVGMALLVPSEGEYPKI
jgi:hypothetical protein